MTGGKYILKISTSGSTYSKNCYRLFGSSDRNFPMLFAGPAVGFWHRRPTFFWRKNEIKYQIRLKFN